MTEESVPSLAALRAAIVAAWRSPEAECVLPLLAEARLSPDERDATEPLARGLAEGLRERRSRAGGVDALMREFSLSSQEGVALMCLAEALLRIPDPATADRLIRDKLRHGHWEEHLGHSPSLFVNAAAWGLLLTGRLLERESAPAAGLRAGLGRVLARGGEPLIRGGIDLAMRLLGEQFVAGHNIEEALERGRRRERQGYRHSFDMLGEAALTDADARAYCAAYEAAIHAIGRDANGRGPRVANGISIKLSALHPRYTWSQVRRVRAELAPRLAELARLARHYDIGMNIDAEEAERLEPSLDLLEGLVRDPTLAGWGGLGFVVQAYQKRAPAVIDWLIALARQSRQPLMIRLVKGAYWDTEIKRAQVEGLTGYPVFSRKVYTDVAFLACARRLLAARPRIYPQFATHNAHTLAAVRSMAGEGADDYEFQCLHGMGEGLYDQLVRPDAGPACRIYAPVGSHHTLLAYLVRRLLENGANNSFVNRVVDESVALDELLTDPVAEASFLAGSPHPRIPLPVDLYAPERANSRGMDLSDPGVRAGLLAALAESRRRTYAAAPLVCGGPPPAQPRPVTNPADPAEVVGTLSEALPAHVDLALACAAAGAPEWAATSVRERVACLERAADALEQAAPEFMALLVREGGKTWPAALAEVREAVDYCRYYAARARTDWSGTGPTPLGPVVCISPWNFPLAIFAGQVVAALVAGNPVLAKPAAQTGLVAIRMVELLHTAGVPREVLQCLPGPGATIGTALVADSRTQGVIFTGSTAVARDIHRRLAARGAADEVPLVAETGGQNAMIVDSTALPEQVVADVLASAFDSAGQRCSALRLLCLQEDIAGPVLHMLKGAMAELRVGPPEEFASDLGPLIDPDAVASVESHCDGMIAAGREVLREELSDACSRGSFLAPTLITIHAVNELKREVFGPVLHVLRYRREALPALVADIGRTGYGLTLGIHSRIDEMVDSIVARARVGNIYVNRNMIGAVVGVQPFGGEGLSGTGPKAGGPFYLGRVVRGGSLPRLPDEPLPPCPALEALAQWLAVGNGAAVGLSALDAAALEARVEEYRNSTLTGLHLKLPGPTGEANSLRLLPRGLVRCLAHGPAGWLHQLAAVLATGNRAELEDGPAARTLVASLPAEVGSQTAWARPGSELEVAAVLCEAPLAEIAVLRQAWADRPGPLRPFLTPAPAYVLSQLLREQTLSINTAAAGGNAALMTMAD